MIFILICSDDFHHPMIISTSLPAHDMAGPCSVLASLWGPPPPRRLRDFLLPTWHRVTCTRPAHRLVRPPHCTSTCPWGRLVKMPDVIHRWALKTPWSSSCLERVGIDRYRLFLKGTIPNHGFVLIMKIEEQICMRKWSGKGLSVV